MAEVTETLQALNKTAQELAKACQGIQTYADELKGVHQLKGIERQPSFDGKASSLYVQSQMASSQYINSVRDDPHARVTFARATPAKNA